MTRGAGLDVNWGRERPVSSEQIWAPWRLAYIQTADAPHAETADLPYCQGPTALFCMPGWRTKADRRRYVIWRGQETIALLNLFPYNNGHLLVAPKRHQGRLDDIPEAGQCELTRVITRPVVLPGGDISSAGV